MQEATVQEFMEAVERAERRHEREHGGRRMAGGGGS